MKKLPIFILMLIALSSGVFQACKPDPEPPVPREPEPPVMSLNKGSEAYEVGDTLRFQLQITTEQELQNLTVVYTEGTKQPVSTDYSLSGQEGFFTVDTL